MAYVIAEPASRSTSYKRAAAARLAGFTGVVVEPYSDKSFWVVADQPRDEETRKPDFAAQKAEDEREAEEAAREAAADAQYEAEQADTWAIPVPDYEPEMKVERRIRETASYVASHRSKVTKLEKDLKWRETRAPHLVDKYRQLISDEMELIELAEREIAPLQVELDVIKRARYEAIAAFWDRVDARVRPQVAHRSENSDLLITPTGKGGYRVELATGKVLTGKNRETGEEFEYPETVFGYEATVYGPDERYGKTFDERIMKPAYPQWGSYSTETVAAARVKMHVYEAAIELAELVNGLLGLGAEGTDR